MNDGAAIKLSCARLRGLLQTILLGYVVMSAARNCLLVYVIFFVLWLEEKQCRVWEIVVILLLYSGWESRGWSYSHISANHLASRLEWIRRNFTPNANINTRIKNTLTLKHTPFRQQVVTCHTGFGKMPLENQDWGYAVLRNPELFSEHLGLQNLQGIGLHDLESLSYLECLWLLWVFIIITRSFDD